MGREKEGRVTGTYERKLQTAKEGNVREKMPSDELQMTEGRTWESFMKMNWKILPPDMDLELTSWSLTSWF